MDFEFAVDILGIGSDELDFDIRQYLGKQRHDLTLLQLLQNLSLAFG